MNLEKQEARKYFKERRNQLTKLESSFLSESIIDNLVGAFNLEGKIVHVFLPIEKFKEVNTRLLLDSNIRCTFLTSRTNFETNTMHHFLIDANTDYELTEYGIPEPVLSKNEFLSLEKIDYVIIPLLAFDEQGGRVGYGKGFYDRFLASCINAKKIGVNYFTPIQKISDLDQYDVKLDYCITPDHIYIFNK